VNRYTYTRAVAMAAALACLPVIAQAQTWTKLAHAPTFNVGSVFLMTDGTVVAQDEGSCGCGAGDWWSLTPDKTGSYVKGTWKQLASMPSGYAPLYYGSEVLPDGRLIVNGGEYNGSDGGVWTTKGAIYDPVKNKWTSVTPPTGWTTIGDAQSTLLDDGTYMLANCCNTDEATLNLKTMKWTPTGKGKADINDEEGWTLLPSGQLLTADANNAQDSKHTEIYTKGTWASAGDAPVQLADPSSHELGPLMLLPNGTVFAVGATGFTAVYTISTGKWATGPTFPKSGSNYFDEADGPSALLPDGNVLLAASPGVFNTGVEFFEFDGKNLNKVPGTPNAPNDSSYYFRLLTLPTGEVLAADGSKDVEIYSSGSPNQAWAPVISKFPKAVKPGQTYKLTGTYLNGFSQAVAYGDDYQANTNYPIVRITHTANGHVFFAKTTSFSSMLPANPNPVTAKVEIPLTIEKGKATFEVIANGIASTPQDVTIK
jgi:hypothetical protein